MRKTATKEPLVLLVPLDSDGKVDVSGPEPWLFKGRWDGLNLYGELRVKAAGLYLIWSDGDEMPIDMEDKRIRVGAVFSVVASGEKVQYEILSVEQV